MSESETLDKFVSRCQGCENVIGMLEHDKCSVLPILKLLVEAKEVTEMWKNTRDINGVKEEGLSFWIRR